MSWIKRFHAPQGVQVAALLAAVAGVALWSTLLLTPAQSHSPVPAAAPVEQVESLAVQWFSQQAAQVDIKVSGVMAGTRGAVAILSLNGGPPRSYLAGERLAQGVRLVAIEAEAVVIEQGKGNLRLNVAKLPDAPFLPVLIRQ